MPELRQLPRADLVALLAAGEQKFAKSGEVVLDRGTPAGLTILLEGMQTRWSDQTASKQQDLQRLLPTTRQSCLVVA